MKSAAFLVVVAALFLRQTSALTCYKYDSGEAGLATASLAEEPVDTSGFEACSNADGVVENCIETCEGSNDVCYVVTADMTMNDLDGYFYRAQCGIAAQTCQGLLEDFEEGTTDVTVTNPVCVECTTDNCTPLLTDPASTAEVSIAALVAAVVASVMAW